MSGQVQEAWLLLSQCLLHGGNGGFLAREGTDGLVREGATEQVPAALRLGPGVRQGIVELAHSVIHISQSQQAAPLLFGLGCRLQQVEQLMGTGDLSDADLLDQVGAWFAAGQGSEGELAEHSIRGHQDRLCSLQVLAQRQPDTLPQCLACGVDSLATGPPPPGGFSTSLRQRVTASAMGFNVVAGPP